MTSIQEWQPGQIRALLQSRGYDVDPVDSRAGDNSLSARRDRAGQAQLVALDRSGRFRAEITVAGGETRRTSAIGPVPVVVVAQHQRTLTVTGSLPHWSHLTSVLDALNTLL